MTHRSCRPTWQPALVAVCIAFTIGCASIDLASNDPGPDIERAQQLIVERTQVSVQLAQRPLASDPAGNRADDLATDPAPELPRPLTAHQAVLEALAHSPEIREGLARLALARADLAEARLWPDPVLGLGFGIPTDGLSGTPHLITLMQQLDWLWTRGPRVAAADSNLAAEILRVAELAIGLIAQTRQLHARVVFGEQALTTASAARAAAVALREVARRELEAGTVSRVALRQTIAEIERTEEELLRRARDLDVAQRELLARLGRPALDAQQLRASMDTSAGGAAPLDDRFSDESDEETLLAGIDVTRLDVAASQARVQAMEASRRGVGRGSWVGIEGMLAHERNHEGRTTIIAGAEIRPRLFGSGRVARARARAVLEREIATAEGIRRRAIEEIRLAWIECRERAEQCARLRAGRLALAEADRADARAEQAAGVLGHGAALATELAYQRVRLDWLDAERDLSLRAHELVRVAGGRLPEPRTNPASSPSSPSWPSGGHAPAATATTDLPLGEVSAAHGTEGNRP